MKLENFEARRALKSFEFANYGNQKQSNEKSFNYSAAVQGLPSLIKMNGLRATMAYYYTKKDDHYQCVFKQVGDWFRDMNEPTKFMHTKLSAPVDDVSKVFMNVLLNLSDDEYRIVQSETLTFANWMIRFVKAESINQNSTPNDTGESQI